MDVVYRIVIPHQFLIIGNETRAAGMLGSFFPGAPARRPLEELTAIDASSVMLWGGEPTLRTDLLDLIRALPQPGMRTDGMSLASVEAVRALREAGLRRVRIMFHSARSDANDWLTGIPGSARGAVRAMRVCADAGLEVEADVCITRPTVAHLPETVAVLSRLPLTRIFLRAATETDYRREHIVMLAPRLKHAAEVARQTGAVLQAFPHCVAAEADAGASLMPVRCDACPGAPSCCGISQQYAQVFGMSEFAPPAAPQQVITIRFDPSQTSRDLRIRMAKLAQDRPGRLRIEDAFNHPQAAELLRDALRLSIPHVEIEGDAAGAARLSDGEIGHLRGLANIRISGENAETQIARFRAI